MATKDGKKVKKYISIADRAMLVDLDVKGWWGKTTDQSAATAVEAAFATEKGAGYFNKYLMPDEREFKDISTAVYYARLTHKTRTLPWGGRDLRIVLGASFMEYSAEMRKCIGGFEKAVSVFLHNYDRLKFKSKKRLGKLYVEEEFPSIEYLKSRFSMKVQVFPVPTAGDFRCKLVDVEMRRIQRQLQETEQENAQMAMQALWTKFYGMVSKVATKLKDDDAIIRDSLIENLREFCEQSVPGMNLTSDGSLEDVRKKVLQELAKQSSEALREDDGLRAEVAKKAADIQKLMAGFMGQSDSK